MDTNKLKHCPFCKDIACIGIDVDGSISGTVGAAKVSCTGCGVTTPFFVDVDDAVEAWNTRVERTCGEWRGEVYITNGGFTESDAHLWCEHCDIPLEEDWRYCPKCGAKIIGMVM